METKFSAIDKTISLFKTTYSNWRNDRTLRLGAGLSYYVVFSLVPMLAISVFISSLFFPEAEVVSYIEERALDLFGSSATEISDYLAQQSVTESLQHSLSSLGIFGIGALIVTASFAIIALNDSVNIIWGRPVQKGLKNTARRYLLSYVIVLSLALVVVATLTVHALLRGIQHFVGLEGTVAEALTSVTTRVVSWTILVLALTWLIRILTSKKVSIKHSLLGSAITILFMYLGVIAIGFYISNFSYQSVASAFSAVLLVLVWVYYESQILLAGFQLTKTLSQRKYLEK